MKMFNRMKMSTNLLRILSILLILGRSYQGNAHECFSYLQDSGITVKLTLDLNRFQEVDTKVIVSLLSPYVIRSAIYKTLMVNNGDILRPYKILEKLSDDSTFNFPPNLQLGLNLNKINSNFQYLEGLWSLQSDNIVFDPQNCHLSKVGI